MVYRPVHLFEAMRPTIILSILTGTLPFHLSHTDGKYTLVTSKMAKTVTMCYTVFYTIMILDAFTTPSNMGILNYYQSTGSNLGLIFELIGGLILTFMIYGNNLIFYQSVKDILIQLSVIDQTLMQFQRNLKYRYMFWYQCAYISFGIVMLCVYILQNANAKASELLMLTFSLRTVLLFPVLIIFVMETQYTSLAKLIQHRFRFINNQLAALNDNNKVMLSEFINVVPVSRGLASKSTEYAAPSPVQRLDTLMCLHDALCDITENINHAYGPRVLISIALKFILSVYSVFYCYWFKVIKEQNWSSVNWFICACHNLYALLNLSVACQKASAEARRTGTHVHKLLLNTANAALKEKLCVFSQQLIHRQVKFTALELFTIDAALLLAIISTGSTYLIILLQFQESPDGNKRT